MPLVQSVILHRDMFTPQEALEWIRQHGYKDTKIDITPQYYRFRQINPAALMFYRLRTIPLGMSGKLIVAYP